MPVVHEDERLLVKHLEFPGFYRVVARYGYVDRVDQGPAFITALLQQLELEQRVLIASKTKVRGLLPPSGELHPVAFPGMAQKLTSSSRHRPHAAVLSSTPSLPPRPTHAIPPLAESLTMWDSSSATGCYLRVLQLTEVSP